MLVGRADLEDVLDSLAAGDRADIHALTSTDDPEDDLLLAIHSFDPDAS